MAIPSVIDTGFKIEEELLWKIEIPIEEILISDIEYNIDIPYLEQIGTDNWNLSPRMLIENFQKETYHANIVRQVDIKYPIEIYLFKEKRIILDGVHRFTKAIMQ